MPTDIKILTARRAYEFHPDDLRLTMLTTPELTRRIQETFGFRTFDVATPMPTFGPVPTTIPPGLVFDYGAMQTVGGQVVPIRFLHFEPRRIVMDVPGPSEAISRIYARVQELLADVQAPDGSRILGEPRNIRDYSELTFRFPFAATALISPALEELATAEDRGSPAVELTAAVEVTLTFQPAGSAYEGRGGTAGRSIQVATRAETRPEDRQYFSTAPLTTDAHIGLLTEIERRTEDYVHRDSR
jgi:hypothetical protein